MVSFQKRMAFTACVQVAFLMHRLLLLIKSCVVPKQKVSFYCMICLHTTPVPVHATKLSMKNTTIHLTHLANQHIYSYPMGRHLQATTVIFDINDRYDETRLYDVM